MSRAQADAASGGNRPERWVLEVGDAAEAQLTIPADLARERRFEIGCALTVRCPDDLQGAWHEMSVFANGALQWQRRIASSNPGSFDGLDYHLSCSVPVGEALRVLVRSAVSGVARNRVVIEADEA